MVDTLRSLKAKLISYKVDNEALVKAQERKEKLNAFLLHSLLEL